MRARQAEHGQKRQTAGRRGFSLVELLVVIGIIVILIGILIPTVAGVRKAGYRTTSKSIIANLQTACEQYYQDFRAYPGVLPDSQLGPTPAAAPGIAGFAANITGTENLALALLGGLRFDDADDRIEYDHNLVGTGAQNLSFTDTGVGLSPRPLTGQKSRAYASGLKTSLDLSQANDPDRGRFRDDLGMADDTIIPEFVDGFPSPLPVLYMRARVGWASNTARGAWTVADNSIVTGGRNPVALGTILPPNVGQYNLNEVLGYTTTAIGEGKADDVPHGLQLVYQTTAIPAVVTASSPYNAFPYLNNPTFPNQARSKDRFILISAGEDRIYGTNDDLCSFGDVN